MTEPIPGGVAHGDGNPENADLDGADLEHADLDYEPDGNRAVGAISRSVLEFVVRSIVDDGDAVVIDANERRGRLELAVNVAPPDMGKVIGRRGHVVQAIRTLVNAAGAREGIEASVEIVD